MKRVLMSIIIATGVVASTGAFAKQLTATVKHVDRKNDSVTLSDGKVYGLPEDIEVESLKPGEKLTVTYALSKSGHRQISKIAH